MFNLEKEFKSFLLLLKSKKALSLIGFGLLVLGLIAGLILIRYPQILQKKAAFDEPTLYFSPTNVSFDVGQEEMVEIYLYSGDESISGVDLTLEYESSDLEITKIEPGPYLTESVLDNPEIDNAVGMARFVYVNTSDNLPSGEFAIARVFVKGKRVVDQTRLLFTSNYEISRESLTQTNNLIIPSISLAGGIYNFISSVVSDGVVIAMIPQEDEVSFGQEFNIAVEVRAGSLNIDGVASHINFDHNLLRVVSIESGTTLPTILMNNFNNQSGSINYVAGILGNTVSGTFTLATITFEPIQQVFSTNLVFETNNPRKTDSTFEGYSVLGNLAGAVIATTLSPDSATVSFNISFQGINNVTDPKPEKQAKVTLKQGDEVIEVFEEVSLTANDNGSYTGRITGVGIGAYDVLIKSRAFLQKNFSSISLNAGLNSFNWADNPLLVGDFIDEGDNYNVLRLADITIMINEYALLEVPVTDENRLFDVFVDGKINIFDIGLVLSNWTDLEIQGDE